MSTSTTQERVIESIASVLGLDVDVITPASRVIVDLEGDSLDFVEIAMDLESEFEIAISEEEIDRWETVQQIIDSVEKQLA